MGNRRNVQLAYPFEEKRLAKWKPPYIVQPKLDGVRCRAVKLRPGLDEGYTLLSSEENIIFGMSHIEHALDALPFRNELDGELYSHGLSFEDIVSRTSRSVNIHEDAAQISFYIFDLVDETMPQIRRINWLHYNQDVIRHPLWLVTSMVAENLDQVMECYDLFVGAGYEGIIVRELDAPYVRKRSTKMMKFKPKRSDRYRVVGWKEEVSKDGVPKGTLGALVCESDDQRFNVGSGFTADERRYLWEIRDSLVGGWCLVQYQHTTTGRSVPRFPVKMVVELPGDKSGCDASSINCPKGDTDA